MCNVPIQKAVMDDDKNFMSGVLWGAKAIAAYIRRYTPRQTLLPIREWTVTSAEAWPEVGEHQGAVEGSPQRADTAMSGIFWPLIVRWIRPTREISTRLFDIVNQVY